MRFTRSTLEKASSAEVQEHLVHEVLERLAEAFRAKSVWRVYPDVIPALETLRSAGVRMGAEAETALHVGDVPELDLAGANAAGLDGLLVDRKGKLDASYEAVADLSDLPRIARDGCDAAIRRS